MQTIDSIKRVIGYISFKIFDINFEFIIVEKGDGFLLQIKGHDIRDNDTGECSPQKGDKYYISKWAIHDEIVLKAWKACQDFIIHEAREGFSYKGQTIFHPHFTLDELAEFTAVSKKAKRNPIRKT